MVKFPPLSLIEGAVLRTKEGTEIVAKELWKEKPVFFFALRRPGCGEHMKRKYIVNNR
jgi:hypothetical protein